MAGGGTGDQGPSTVTEAVGGRFRASARQVRRRCMRPTIARSAPAERAAALASLGIDEGAELVTDHDVEDTVTVYVADRKLPANT